MPELDPFLNNAVLYNEKELIYPELYRFGRYVYKDKEYAEEYCTLASEKQFMIATEYKKLLSAVEEKTVYAVMAQAHARNPEHETIMHIGFTTGGYCVIYGIGYEEPVDLYKMYSIRILKKLYTYINK